MDVMHSCRCCLRCAPDRDLTTPYTHLGETEIYSDLLKECFDLHLEVSGDGSCGICSACAGRLRDAHDFKLQVQRSQARLQGVLRVKEHEPAVEPGMEEGDRISEEPEYLSDEEPAMAGGDDTDVEISPTLRLAREQLAMTCCVRLERLRGDEAPHESRTSLATLHESRRASRVKEPHDNTAGLRAEEAYTCDTCGKHFTGKSSLIAHVRSHLVQVDCAARYSRGTCSEQFSGDNLFLKHTQTHTRNKTNSIDMCHRQFKAKLHLLRHKLIDSGGTCEECKKDFTTKVTLARHKRINTGEKPYRCEECNKQFTRQHNLAVHKRIHTGEKPYSCEECKMQFTHKITLVIHKRKHTGEKPYSCKECIKQFTRKDKFEAHIKVHTQEKQHVCKICKELVSGNSNLIKHLQKHVNFNPQLYQRRNAVKLYI